MARGPAINYYFDPVVQLEIQKTIKAVGGVENREDARQYAYEALADECPITLEDAKTCVRSAITRFRNRLRRMSKYERTWFDDGAYVSDEYTGEYNGPKYYNQKDDSSASSADLINPRRTSKIDKMFLNTETAPRHGKEYYRYWLQHA